MRLRPSLHAPTPPRPPRRVPTYRDALRPCAPPRRPARHLALALSLFVWGCGPASGPDQADAGAPEAASVEAAPHTGSTADATGASDAGPSPPLSSAETRRELRDLMVAVTPPPPAATAGFKNDWFEVRRRTLERLRRAGPAFGRAALEEYRTQDDALDEVRIGLLDVGAHAAPEEARPLLVELITTFGDSLAVRTAACEILSRTSPGEAVALLGPILAETKHRITYPPEEKLLLAWIRAAEHEGIEKEVLLADIAVQLERDHATRQAAVRALADCDGQVAAEALQSLIVESSGDHVLRRAATQSLREVLPREAFCDYVRSVMELESDQAFQLFLADTLEVNCGA